ncbi:MAG: hemerythrin domain-containing protein [Gammaproteobacteria bacterium]|nr:MAG: hemerythrin domain-containing protein [Gammaproteobacteria bacterium]
MYTLDELKRQNQEITDLVDILSVLMQHPHLRKNPFVCDLVSSFNEKVWMHLVFEENTIYCELARHHNPDISNIAKKFHDTSRQVKKHFSHYVKLWCQTSANKADQETFLEESQKVFDLVRERIRFENDEMFPLVEKHFDS